jgi:hypothetical protein
MKLTAVHILLFLVPAVAATAGEATFLTHERRLVEVDSVSHHPRRVVQVVGNLRGSALRELDEPSFKKLEPRSEAAGAVASTTRVRG